jgi:two-component system OmpR family response regulator
MGIKMSNAKILIVDDDRDIVPLFEQMFKKETTNNLFTFVFKFSYDEALEYLHSDDNAELVLILSDINMPGRNGIELLQAIKTNDINTPVFLFTAFDDQNNRLLAEQYRVDKYLVKPIDFVALKTDIIELIQVQK